MARWVFILGVLACLTGAAIIAYGAYEAFHPRVICHSDGTGCGDPQGVHQ